MIDLIKTLKRQTLIVALCYLAAGLLFVCIPDITANAVAILIAVALFITGGVFITMYFASREPAQTGRAPLSIGLLLVIAALVFFIKPSLLVSIAYIILGFCIVVNGTIKLQAAVEVRRNAGANWGAMLIAAGVAIILGAIVIFAPFATAKAVTVMIGVSMICCALFDIVSALFLIK